MIVQWGLRCTCQNTVIRLHDYFCQLGSFHLVICFIQVAYLQDCGFSKWYSYWERYHYPIHQVAMFTHLLFLYFKENIFLYSKSCLNCWLHSFIVFVIMFQLIHFMVYFRLTIHLEWGRASFYWLSKPENVYQQKKRVANILTESNSYTLQIVYVASIQSFDTNEKIACLR